MTILIHLIFQCCVLKEIYGEIEDSTSYSANERKIKHLAGK